MDISQRLKKVPPYIFVELDKMKKEAIERGEDVIALSIGDPDLPTPQIIVDALKEAAQNPENHCYPLGTGKPAFREAIAHYYASKHGVPLNPHSEVLALIGSKEGIGHLPFAIIDEGDVVLYPEPGYPVYRIATLFAGGTPWSLPLRAENSFLPDLESVPRDVLDRTKLLFLNYPNNPTAAFASAEFFEKAVFFARKHEFIVAHDAAYMDMVFPGERATSFLAVPGAKDVGIELHSFSKTFHMTGWRLGFAVGNKTVISALAALKSNLDSGVFGAIQDAGIVALQHYDEIVPSLNATYAKRCEVLITGLTKLGWTGFTKPKGTFYVWCPTQGNLSSMEMTKLLLKECSILVTPGTAFGETGEGYIRFALTAAEGRIAEAINRMQKAGI